ncbi:hypothetical protein [Hyalangium sp.]|uniref:hypothetical protein n=1 Tax=Hyalangium sp. TaxID=2028555 RepID=UPI00389AE917
MPLAVALFVLLAQVTACQPAPEPETGGTNPDQPTGTPQVQTAPYSLTASARDPGTGPELPPGNDAFLGVLTNHSALGALTFRYDAYVVTALETGRVRVQSDVLEANPNGYQYGYAYPLDMMPISRDGAILYALPTSSVQNALETGTAVYVFDSVEAGHQYILEYKTFESFTPLTYRLTLPSSLKVEGQIYAPPQPVPVPVTSEGLITLENPRPDALSRFVPTMNARVSGN